MCYIVCMSPSSLGNCTIYSTWCIMICLVIPILSLLLFIQSLYSLSKLHCCRRPNLYTLQRLVVFRSESVNETIVLHYVSHEQNLLFHCVCVRFFKHHFVLYIPMYIYVRVHVHYNHLCCMCMTCSAHIPSHPSAADEAWHWPKRILRSGRLVNI